MAEKITKEMNIGEIVREYPQTAQVFFDMGIHCVGCVASHFETLEEGMKAHGKSDDEIAEIVNQLNKVAEQKE